MFFRCACREQNKYRQLISAYETDALISEMKTNQSYKMKQFVYEIQMPEEDTRVLHAILERSHITIDELFN